MIKIYIIKVYPIKTKKNPQQQQLDTRLGTRSKTAMGPYNIGVRVGMLSYNVNKILSQVFIIYIFQYSVCDFLSSDI